LHEARQSIARLRRWLGFRPGVADVKSTKGLEKIQAMEAPNCALDRLIENVFAGGIGT
jgi:hypothetical protein